MNMTSSEFIKTMSHLENAVHTLSLRASRSAGFLSEVKTHRSAERITNTHLPQLSSVSVFTSLETRYFTVCYSSAAAFLPHSRGRKQSQLSSDADDFYSWNESQQIVICNYCMMRVRPRSLLVLELKRSAAVLVFIFISGSNNETLTGNQMSQFELRHTNMNTVCH